MRKGKEITSEGLRPPRLLSEMTPEEIAATRSSVTHTDSDDSKERIQNASKRVSPKMFKTPRYTNPATGEIEGGVEIGID